MSEISFAVVQSDEAKLDPYPYIYVNDSGSYRELSNDEKEYLQETFHPSDGNRPYVKSRYRTVTADAQLSGFLNRKKLRRDLKEGEVPEPKKWWEFWRR